ncbi:hypothetical protein ECZU22_37030 [Escherichia coli]|nr:hypothetical protein ECZU22_37030 [Escherichia coli]
MTRAVKPRRFAIRPIIYASVLSAGVLLCAFSAHADERDQLKSIQADIAAKERAVRQKQQQRASLLAQLKKQEEAISEATRKLRETQNTLNQLNKQIDEMNASIAKLEQQKAAQERSLAAQLDAAFRQGEHTGIQLILSGEESQRGQRLQAYFGYLNQARQETIAQLKQTREEVAMQRAELEEKQSEQQTLLYEQRAQQAKLTQALSERKKTLAGLESSIQQGQQQLSELRANESRLRNSIARAEARRKRVLNVKRAKPGGSRPPERSDAQRHHLQADRKRKIADVPYRWSGRTARSGILAGSRANAASLWRAATG